MVLRYQRFSSQHQSEIVFMGTTWGRTEEVTCESISESVGYKAATGMLPKH
jgi:hypothetical protein